MSKPTEYNFHEMTIEQINEVLQPFIDAQIHDAKDWTERYSGIIKYMNENYYNLHPLKIPVEKLEQVNRNLKRWKNQFDLIKTSEKTKFFEIKRSVESAISSINEQIEYLKRNPTNHYKHIFSSEQGYKIFKAWREYTNDDTKIINFEFIFHQLQYDNYLVEDLKPSVFLNFLLNIRF